MTRWEQEQNQLPEHPSYMTYRGRYDHVDSRIAELLDFSHMSAGTPIRVLDVGCGILHFGSPTMHDFWDVLEFYHLNPMMVGVDVNIPENLSPSYPILYVKSMREVQGRFDIVRMLRVSEHVSEGEYEKLRTKALRRLRVGGLFIATQGLGRWKVDSVGPDLRWLEPVIKIAQKRRGGFLHVIDLVPDALIPWQTFFMPLDKEDREDALREYGEYRAKVFSGVEDIPLVSDERGYQTFLSWLKNYPPEILNHERVEWQNERGFLRRDLEDKWKEEEMHQAASEASSWFRKPGIHYVLAKR